MGTCLSICFLCFTLLCSAVFLFLRLLQKVAAQQQEINMLLQNQPAVEEDGALMTALTTLREELDNKNQQLEVGGQIVSGSVGPHQDQSVTESSMSPVG